MRPVNDQNLDFSGERIAVSTAHPYRPYESRRSPEAVVETWVQIDLGSTRPFDRVDLFPSNRFIRHGDGFPLRFRIEASGDPAFVDPQLIADRSAADYPDPDDRILVFPTDISARYVRITATRLREAKVPDISFDLPREAAVYRFCLSKVAVRSGATDIAEGRPVAVDAAIGDPSSAAQITRPARPGGEGVVTDQPGCVSDPETWTPPNQPAVVPTSGVSLEGGLFATALERNIRYLLRSSPAGDLLRPFRKRAGLPAEPAARRPHPFWDEELAGSSAGRFLLGAGAALRWVENTELRDRMEAVVAGIAECQDANGFLMAYPEESLFYSERGAYTRAWTTLGLIAAGHAGCAKAFEILRRHYDRFNLSPELPEMLRRCNQGGQGMVANTGLYFTPVGRSEDIQVVQRHFQEDYWLEALAARDPSAIWLYPYDRPHCYLLTNVLAYLDLYLATGEARYVDAVDGAWDLFRSNWIAVGGALSIIELIECPPHSHSLYDLLGETCGSAFWILLNHRLHLMRPDDERYIAEIERSIYNVIIANQGGDGGIRYHACLLGRKEPATQDNTCCEGQGARTLSSLPAYVYSLVQDGVSVNLFEPSSISWRQDGADRRLTMHTGFPYSQDVAIQVETPAPSRFRIRLRVPSWTTVPLEVSINGKKEALGAPGTFLDIVRTWAGGDRIEFRLSAKARMTRYQGVDQVAKRERFWLEYGPLLMAATGAGDARIVLFGLRDPEGMVDRLRPEGDACHFVLPGLAIHPDIRFSPYFEIDEEPFSCAPVVDLWNHLG